MDNAASVTTKTSQGSEQRRLDTARKVSRGNVSFWAALSSVATNLEGVRTSITEFRYNKLWNTLDRSLYDSFGLVTVSLQLIN